MQPAKAAHGAFFSLAGSSLPPGLRARRARFPTCGVIHVAGYSVVWDCGPTPIFLLKSTKRSAAAISRPQRSFITFHGALWNILLPAGFPVMFHMITSKQMFVNALLQIFFLLLLLNRPFDILDFVENRLHKIFWGSQSTAPLENTRFSPFFDFTVLRPPG